MILTILDYWLGLPDIFPSLVCFNVFIHIPQGGLISNQANHILMKLAVSFEVDSGENVPAFPQFYVSGKRPIVQITIWDYSYCCLIYCVMPVLNSLRTLTRCPLVSGRDSSPENVYNTMTSSHSVTSIPYSMKSAITCCPWTLIIWGDFRRHGQY